MNERKREKERGGRRRRGRTVSICMMAVWLRQDNCNLSRRHERRVNFIAAIPESQSDGKTAGDRRSWKAFAKGAKAQPFISMFALGESSQEVRRGQSPQGRK